MRFEATGGGKGTGVPKAAPLPKLGHLLLSRTPHTNFLRVTWPDGQYRTLTYDRQGDLKLIRMGVPRDHLDRALNYLWNFLNVYVAAPNCPQPPPPINDKEANRGGARITGI